MIKLTAPVPNFNDFEPFIAPIGFKESDNISEFGVDLRKKIKQLEPYRKTVVSHTGEPFALGIPLYAFTLNDSATSFPWVNGFSGRYLYGDSTGDIVYCGDSNYTTIPQGGGRTNRFVICYESLQYPNRYWTNNESMFIGNGMTSVLISAKIRQFYCNSSTCKYIFLGDKLATNMININLNSLSGCVGNLFMPYGYLNWGQWQINCSISSVSICSNPAFTTIPANMFSSCNNMTDVVVPPNVKTIGGVAFRSCAGLITLDHLGEITTLDQGALQNLPNVNTIIIPDTVAYIPGNCFYGNSNLRHVTLGTGCTSVDYWAFYITGWQNAASTSAFSITVRSAIPPTVPNPGYMTQGNGLLIVPYDLTIARAYYDNASWRYFWTYGAVDKVRTYDSNGTMYYVRWNGSNIVFQLT